MFLHSVYFWLKEDLDETAKFKFLEGLRSLNDDSNVVSGYAGPPVYSPRDVVDTSYTFGLVLVFLDKAGHDSYQTGAPHHRFLKENKEKWDRILVLDFEG